jgi:hypothetical protein
MDFNLRHLARLPRPHAGAFSADAKHEDMLMAIAPYAKHSTRQVNERSASLDYVTKSTKFLLVLLPEWSPFFPPFNLARLSAVAKAAGFQSRIMDINVRAYNLYKKVWQPQGKLAFQLWNPSASWRWVGTDNYMSTIHPLFEELFLEVIEDIVAFNPGLLGFSQYYINKEPTDWMAQQLKKRLPHTKFAVGGSNIQNGWHVPQPYYDYVVNGEGEETILRILDEVERGVSHESTLLIKQPEDQRLSINELPLPDYSDIDFNLYEIPNGVNSELSRGCTAKCVFCEETHFYKYRQRSHADALREIEHLYHTKGTDVVWFIDSLVNGSLKELRAFCKGVIERGLKIKWTGYARCDGRMDREYYQDLADSGCVMLNYGIESGSQKVLNDMNKGITIEEIEQNLKHGKETGVWAATNWIVGFPTETYDDFARTMTFIWRNRNMNINNIGAGTGYGLGLETIVGQNFERYNVLDSKYMGHWITRDFKFGGTHLMVRVKSFNIFLDHLLSKNKVSYPFRQNLRNTHYVIQFDDPTIQNEVEFEEFDYRIIHTKINPFADSLVNEIWPLFRNLWRIRGGYEAKILFNPEIDLEEFGTQYGPGTFRAEYRFKIDGEGNWSAEIDLDFAQKPLENDTREPDRRGPFFAQDYSRLKSPSATRARRLAKPSWGEEGRSGDDFTQLLAQEKFLNQTIDFSFRHHWKGSGFWSHSLPTFAQSQESDRSASLEGMSVSLPQR